MYNLLHVHPLCHIPCARLCQYVFTYVAYVCILLYADDIVLVAEKEINL